MVLLDFCQMTRLLSQPLFVCVANEQIALTAVFNELFMKG